MREEKKRVFVCYIVGEYFGRRDQFFIITKLPQIFLNWIPFVSNVIFPLEI